jgi:hypothetical protein
MLDTDGPPVATAGIATLIAEMEVLLERLEAAGDPKRYFHATYLRTTRAVAEALEAGQFGDPEWVERWDLAFAELYLRALRQERTGDPLPAPWAVAFKASRDQPDLPPLRHVLLGMNAHINYDLPQALLEVITDDEFADPAVRRRRSLDHEMIDTVLSQRVRDEDRQLAGASGGRVLLDRLLTPLNRLGTKRFLREARQKVWGNALQLSRARRSGPFELERSIAELARVSAAKLEQLTAPGQVLLRLTISGFGVRLASNDPGPRRFGGRGLQPPPFRAFEPLRLGRRERDVWVAYYRHEWIKLLWASIKLVRDGFRFSWPATLRGAWFVLRANQLWAPVPDNDPDGARRYMRRFYQLVAKSNDEPFDPIEAARLEVEWWRIHREIQRRDGIEAPTTHDLVASLSALYAYVYSIDAGLARPAAVERVQAMALSDRWVELGCEPASALLMEEANALVRSYAHLLAAIHRA